MFSDYERLEAEAKSFLRTTSKPLVARYVARKLAAEYDEEEEGWERFRELAESIKEVDAPSA
jgi:hypothetical protein